KQKEEEEEKKYRNRDTDWILDGSGALAKISPDTTFGRLHAWNPQWSNISGWLWLSMIDRRS
ncbi:hypothetical protein ASPCADRAFT_204012, partial [Aspergillus carbonarius ITEM 5010]